MATMIIFLLLSVLIGQASPLPTDLDTLPVAPDFMEVHLCTEGVPLIDCFHPQHGLVYGAMPDKPIYRATAGVGSDLATGRTAEPDSALAKRLHNYYLDCGNRGTYDFCSTSPRLYYCSRYGQIGYEKYDMSCSVLCHCSKLGGFPVCVLYHGKCMGRTEVPGGTAAEGTEAGGTAVDGKAAEADGEGTEAGGNVVDGTAAEGTQAGGTAVGSDLETGQPPKPDSALAKRLHNYYLDCGNRATYDYCSGYPHLYYCDRYGQVGYQQNDISCSVVCRCYKLGGPEAGGAAVDVIAAEADAVGSGANVAEM